MNPETGEIKVFPDELKVGGKGSSGIPLGWESLPDQGTEVEVVMPPSKKRGRMWKIVGYVEDKPGQMLLEATPETKKKLSP